MSRQHPVVSWLHEIRRWTFLTGAIFGVFLGRVLERDGWLGAVCYSIAWLLIMGAVWLLISGIGWLANRLEAG